ncbi:tRNA 2-selenouridine(34) synthase MnmH [Fusobacterium sp.]|uniref:tRNA 2-selenouridine(34) synthase MnmH n=1 Tax=Fusobacterium sp. TaxID=68766 RepID=UPI00396C998A
MKLMNFEDFLKEESAILVDVRTPKEFTIDNVPNTVNIPVLLDEERVEVGTTYVQVSKEKAKELGIQFISKRLPEIFKQVQELSEKYSLIVFMCARGGMRSGSMASLFDSLGYKIGKLQGGYKLYRKYVQSAIPELNKNFKYIVVHGKTGVGKTKILNKMSSLGISTMDLEGMAAHKGSFFGALGEKLPQSQKRFDGSVFEFLRTCKTKYIVVESESKRIGNVYIPESVYQSMTDGIHLYIDTDIKNRIDILMEDYAHVPLNEIKKCIMKVSRYVSKEKTANYLKLLEEKRLEELCAALIKEYYDPLYTVSGSKHDYLFSMKFDDSDVCAAELAEFIKKLEEKN